MRAIAIREIKNFLRNPIFWVGLVIMAAGIYQQLAPYLNLHYFKSDQEIQSIAVSDLDEADVMDGYTPPSAEEKREAGYKKIRSDIVDGMKLSEQEADTAINTIWEMDEEEACQYLKREYGMLNAENYFDGSNYEQRSAQEVNTFMEEKLQEHTFYYYFAKKFADFTRLFMSFFAAILLAFLFLRDTRKSNYELLHTKPITAWQYVIGKTAGGFLSLIAALGILTAVFSILCVVHGKMEGFSVNGVT